MIKIILLYLLSLIVASYLLIDSVTYSGFLMKHLNFNILLIQNITFFYGVLISLLRPFFKINDTQQKYLKKILIVNLLLAGLFSISALLMYLLDRYVYINFVFSSIHVQPKLFAKVATFVYVPLIPSLVYFFNDQNNFTRLLFTKIRDTVLLIWTGIQKKLKIKIHFLSLKRIKLYILILYTLSLVIYLIINSFNFINKFYMVDTSYRQQNELKYLTGEMDIYEWIKEYLPKTNDVILWCNKQTSITKLVTFDPEIIWMSYDALSRVFLTNCFYANIDPVSKSYDYFEADELLLVSVSKCDPEMIDTHPDPKSEIIKYFKIVNNDYICKSKEIVPNLYLYKK